MEYAYIPRILLEEGTVFQSVERRWRPTDLLFVRQTQSLLQDMSERYARLAAAESELVSLERGNVYVKYLRRMHLWVRRAQYTWKSDHLQFVQTVSGFYSDYGAVLRLLKMDEARGRFNNRPGIQGV